MFYAILSLCFFNGALAWTFNGCPRVEPVSDFRLSDYMGQWYVAQYHSVTPQDLDKCKSVVYSLTDSNRVRMESSHISVGSGYEIMNSEKLTLSIPDPDKPAKLKKTNELDPDASESDYFVLGTDYNNYALVYGCTTVSNVKHASILTRERNAPQSIIDEAFGIAEKNGLSWFGFKKMNQFNCD